MSRSAMPRRSRPPPRCWRASADNGRPYVSLLQSRKHNFFTDGARELFDCAGQGRIDVFFLSGGQIDGQGNVNLVSTGDYAHPQGALPRLVRLGLSLLRGAQSDFVPHRAFAPHAGADRSISSARRAPATRTSIARAGRSRWSPTAACSRSPMAASALASVHPGHTVAEVIENTGFEFDQPADGAGNAGALARHAQAACARRWRRNWPRSIRSSRRRCSGSVRPPSRAENHALQRQPLARRGLVCRRAAVRPRQISNKTARNTSGETS